MKYMLLIHANAKQWGEMDGASPEALRPVMDYMEDLNREIQDRGEWVDANGLTGPKGAKLVHTGPGGEVVVTDGPFSEAKEFLAGYWVVDVASEERAIEIAARAARCPGLSGEPGSDPVEVHRVG